nr:immunoglobulin heavy chain junction region [Mus musculus]
CARCNGYALYAMDYW